MSFSDSEIKLLNAEGLRQELERRGLKMGRARLAKILPWLPFTLFPGTIRRLYDPARCLEHLLAQTHAPASPTEPADEGDGVFHNSRAGRKTA